MKKLRRTSAYIRISAFAVVLATVSAYAFAAPLPVGGAAVATRSVFEQVVGRFMLGETPTGLRLMSETLGRTATAQDIDEFLRVARASAPERLAGLESRARRIERELTEIRDAHARSKGQRAPEKLTPDERLVLAELSRAEIHLRPLATVDPVAAEIEFAASSATGAAARGGLKASEGRFLGGARATEEPPLLRLAETPADDAPAALQTRAKRSLREWRDDAQNCLKNSPAETASSTQWRNTVEALLITAGVTTVGTVAQVGVAHIGDIDGGQFGIDLGGSLFWTLVGMKWVKHSDGFEVRWLKASTQSVLRAPIEAEIYRISPWTNTHGVPMEQAVAERTHFNLTWTAKTSWISPLVSSILNGAECLIGQPGTATAVRNAKWFARGAFAVKTGVSAGSSVLYFRARQGALQSAGVTR